MSRWRMHVLHVPGADSQRDDIVAQLREEADACVHEDPERRGCINTWLTAMECARRDESPWSVVVSDDAKPAAAHWKEQLDAALWHSPSPVLGLTYFGGYTNQAHRKGRPYAQGKYLVWGGGIAYRRDIVDGLYMWAGMIYEEIAYQHDDVLVAAYGLVRGYVPALTTRAIFDQPVDRSLLGHNTPIRRPALTIADAGPSWALRPAVQPTSRSINPKGELERLASIR